MKEEILSIASDLREGSMTTKEAKSQLLVLFGVTNRTCYNCKYCMYESKKPKHEQFTCLGTIDLNHITDPHHHICKLWDE